MPVHPHQSDEPHSEMSLIPLQLSCQLARILQPSPGPERSAAHLMLDMSRHMGSVLCLSNHLPMPVMGMQILQLHRQQLCFAIQPWLRLVWAQCNATTFMMQASSCQLQLQLGCPGLQNLHDFWSILTLSQLVADVAGALKLLR